jgi:hypothetical protein
MRPSSLCGLDASASSGRAGAMGETTGHAKGILQAAGPTCRK